MARPLRLEFSNAVYHITIRGNAYQNIFIDDEDRQRFLDLLGREIHQQGWYCYAYCLMDNHYHLLIETPHANLVAGMRRFNGVYTQGFNRRHECVGHLFQGRYKSIIVDRENFLLELCRHVVLNPVRVGRVKRTLDWKWSSYRATIDRVKAPDWLNTKWILNQFGRRKSAAIVAYRKFVAAGAKAESPWEHLQGQIWLGDDAFRERMETMLRGKNLAEISSSQASPTRPTKEAVVHAVLAAYKLEEAELFTRSHQAAYRAAAYLLRRVANLQLKSVADLFGISSSRISHIQRSIEQGEVDTKLAKLLRKYKIKN